MINEKKTYKQFILLFTTGLFSYFIMNTANAYLVRVLGDSAYGDFALTISLLFSLTPFFSVGITSLITKYIPIYLKNESPSETNIFLRWNTNILKKSFIIISIVIITTVFLRATHLNEPINRHIPCFINNCEYYRHFIIDLFFLIPVALLLVWNISLLNATKNSLAAQIFGIGSVTYICAFVIFILELFLESFGHNEILMAIFLGFIILCIAQYISIYIALIKPKKILLSEIKQQIVSKETSSFYLKSGISLMLNSIIYIAMGLVTMLMLEWISPNEVVLGHYVIITKISSIFAVMSGAFGFLMAPYYSGLKDNNRLKNFQKYANKQIIIGLIWLMICITIFLTFREIIFKAYSIDFDHATFAIIISLIWEYLFSIIRVSEMICLLNDINKVLYPVSFLQLITLGLLCYILIPHFSFLGAIYAFFISETFCALICWFIVRFHGIKIKIFGFI